MAHRLPHPSPSIALLLGLLVLAPAIGAGAGAARAGEPAASAGEASPSRSTTMNQPSPTRGMKPSPAASTVEYQRIADRLAVLLNIHYTGQADLDFTTLIKLLNEHAAALARVELAHGTAPGARQLAEQVLAHREQETPAGPANGQH